MYTVLLNLASVNAVLPLDVLPFTSTLTFDLGDTRECVTIPIVDDDLLEDTESFSVSAFSLSSAATVVANRSSANVLIADNESKNINVQEAFEYHPSSGV